MLGVCLKAPLIGGFCLYGAALTNIIYNIKTGQVLICDFERGFVPPEMVKKRPVVVISKNSTHSRGLCTIVPLSTTKPTPIELWHVALSSNPLPHLGNSIQVWAKCDMVYTVSHQRLNRPHHKKAGKRDYLEAKVSATDLQAIFNGLRAYLPAER